MNTLQSASLLALSLTQRLIMVLFAALAAGMIVSTAMSAAGVWPWIDLDLGFDGAPVANAGMIAQIGLTVLTVGLCLFLPSASRVMKLEHSHRRFDLDVDDITRAYSIAHAADRASTFKIGDAFETTKDRLAHLRDHPDLQSLEPELLEMAAQMSFVSRDLAERYSDKHVARAKSVLEQRQYELEELQERIERAKLVHTDFKAWMNRMEVDENVAAAQIDRLRDDLEQVLPELYKPAVSQPVVSPPKYRPPAASKVARLPQLVE